MDMWQSTQAFWLIDDSWFQTWEFCTKSNTYLRWDRRFKRTWIFWTTTHVIGAQILRHNAFRNPRRCMREHYSVGRSQRINICHFIRWLTVSWNGDSIEDGVLKNTHFTVRVVNLLSGSYHSSISNWCLNFTLTYLLDYGDMWQAVFHNLMTL